MKPGEATETVAPYLRFFFFPSCDLIYDSLEAIVYKIYVIGHAQPAATRCRCASAVCRLRASIDGGDA